MADNDFLEDFEDIQVKQEDNSITVKKEVGDEILNEEVDERASIAELKTLLDDEDDYDFPFGDSNMLNEKKENTKLEALPEATMDPSECDCCGKLVNDNSLDNIAVCEKCHDVPYKMDWAIMPPLHTVYKKNLKSEEGPPTVVVTKKKDVKHNFDNLLVIAFLKNCKDGSEPSKQYLEGRTEESKPYFEITQTTKFDFQKLKIIMTSQQNKGNNFQLVLQLVAEQGSTRFPLGTLTSSPMNIYSHKNLLPENKKVPHIIDMLPRILPMEGGRIAIQCKDIQDSKDLKVKIGDTIIEKIPRRGAALNAKGITVHNGSLFVDVPPAKKEQEKVYVTVTNNGTVWSKVNKNQAISFKSTLSNIAVGEGPSLEALMSTIGEVLKKEYEKHNEKQREKQSDKSNNNSPRNEESEHKTGETPEEKAERRRLKKERKERKLQRKRERESGEEEAHLAVKKHCLVNK